MVSNPNGRPQIRFTGPYRSDGSSLDGGQPPVDLYNVETARDDANTETNQQSVFGQSEGDAILAPLTGSRTIEFDGKASGQRLYQAGFGSTPRRALREYLKQLESLILPVQGNGYRVDDDVRGKTFDPNGEEDKDSGVIVDTVRWNHETGDVEDAEYRVEGEVTEGVQEGAERTRDKRYERFDGVALPPTADEEDRLYTSIAGDNFTLGYVEERRFEMSVDLDVSEVANQFDLPNFGLITSGVEGEFSLSGIVSDRHVEDDSVGIEDVALAFNEDLQGEDVVIWDSLTRRWIRGALSTGRTTFEAGKAHEFEYDLDLTIGRNVV